MNVDSCCSTLSGMDMLDTNLIFSGFNKVNAGRYSFALALSRRGMMCTHGYLYFPYAHFPPSIFPYAYSTHFPPTLYVGSELSDYNSLPEGLFLLLRLLLFSFG